MNRISVLEMQIGQNRKAAFGQCDDAASDPTTARLSDLT
jgi:hypothetical protein